MVRLCKVFAIESDNVGTPKCLMAAVTFVVISVVVRATILRPYATRGSLVLVQFCIEIGVVPFILTKIVRDWLETL